MSQDRSAPMITSGELSCKDEYNSPQFIQFIMQSWGAIFCIQWLVAQLLFPVFKERLGGYAPVAAGVIIGSMLSLPRVRSAINEIILSWPSKTFLISTISAAFGLRLLAIYWFPKDPIGDHLMFHGYALNLIAGKGYGNPGYRAFYPPGMSFLLAGWYVLTKSSAIAGTLLNAVISTGIVLVVYQVGKRSIGLVFARWAAILAATMPTLVFYSATLGYETALAFIFLATVYIGISVVVVKNKRGLLSIVVGLFLGLGSLIKPICLPIVIFLGIWWAAMGLGRYAWSCFAVVLLVMVAVISPWTVRNYRLFGEFVPISTNGGGVLYNANNSDSSGLYMVVQPLPGEHDEISRDRIRYKAAVKWIVENPMSWMRLAVNKIVYTWGTASAIMSFVSYDRLPGWQENLFMAILNTFWSMLLVLCFTATLTTRIWSKPEMWIGYLLLGYVFMIQLFFEALSRHHIPVIPILILVAAASLDPTQGRIKPKFGATCA